MMTTTIAKLASTAFLAGALICSASPAAYAETEDRVEKSFAVSTGGQLIVNADRGSIEVAATEGGTVEVKVVRKAKGPTEAKEKEMLQDHELTFNPQGDKVEITARYKGGGHFWQGWRHQLQVRFMISVPRKYNVDLKTAGGSITVSDLTGKVKVETSGGNLKIGSIQGPVWAKTSGGNVALAGATEAADLRTSGGSIDAGEVQGSLVAQTHGGSITIRHAKGDVVAKTSGGNITIDDVGGTIDASTSGGSVSARFAVQPKGNSSLRSSGGSIRVDLSGALAVDLDARTSAGRVTVDLPVTVHGEQKSHHLQGKINGGGPVLELKTSAGNIHLRKL
ncbi:MAG: DUF4097 family beta strand repeat protein [Verrucomicrobia bacterium]|nr:DUF4097 family beta strand repeat protein [Verrucomicrobiota bacterium]